ncbi:MAG: hypothetical protein C0501_00335 [Isosphaera sp.]|nr:hypothetical protein [Isosphaera sp.]
MVFTDGKPAAELAGGSVSLESAGGAAARGEIRPDGTFRLGTRGPDDGVVPGEYRAVVVGYTSFLPEKEPRPALAAKYRSFDTSGLTVTVKPVPNQVELVVERPKR